MGMRSIAGLLSCCLALFGAQAMAQDRAFMGLKEGNIGNSLLNQYSGITLDLFAMPRDWNGVQGSLRKEVVIINRDCPQEPCQDPRITIDRQAEEVAWQARGWAHSPYSAIGIVHTPLYGGVDGTGFLIGRCLVATNYHGVFAPAENAKLNKKGFYFLIQQYGSGESKFEATEALPIYWGDFDYGEGNRKEDWVILRISPDENGKCFGDKYGWLAVVHDAKIFSKDYGGVFARKGRIMEMAGYPISQNNYRMMSHKKCQINSDDVKYGLNHDCSSVPGNSGSPIFICGNDEHVCGVIAMHATSYSEPGKEDRNVMNGQRVLNDIIDRRNDVLYGNLAAPLIDNFYNGIVRAREIQDTMSWGETIRAAKDEQALWDSVSRTKVTAGYQQYLEKYPNGQFGGLARNRLKVLENR